MVFTLVMRAIIFDVGVKLLTLNPMVEFLTSAKKVSACQSPDVKTLIGCWAVRTDLRTDAPTGHTTVPGHVIWVRTAS